MLKHEHILITAQVDLPPKDVIYMEQWVRKLVSDIGMKILLGPYAVYCDMIGNRGLTIITAIETSHLVVHSWDEEEPNRLEIDLYSCAYLDKDVVFKAIEEFKPTKIEYKFINREDGLTLIEHDIII